MIDASMAARRRDRSLRALGGVFAAGGLYFVLMGLGAGVSSSRLDGANSLAMVIGLVFVAAGAAMLVRGRQAVSENRPGLRDGTPPALAVIQWIAALAIIVGLASIGTWIAIGSGNGAFAMMLPLPGSPGETVGRVAFGIAALITWLMAAAVATKGIRKAFGKKA